MTKRQLCVFILILLCFPFSSAAEEGTWTRKSDMPTGKLGFAMSVVNDTIFVVGGFGGSDSSVEAYNPATDTWTKRSHMPTGRPWIPSAVVNGRIYVFGGTGALQTVEEYDPVTDTWRKRADMPMGATAASAAVVKGKIYVIGGSIPSEEQDAWISLSTVQEYDPATDTWAKKADLLTSAGIAASVAAVNDKIYVFGGQTGYASWNTAMIDPNAGDVIPTVQEYDPARDTWAKKANMPTARSATSAVVFEGKVYVFGGRDADFYSDEGSILPTVEVYDPLSDTWTKEDDMPTPRCVHSSVVMNGKIYVMGGMGERIFFIGTIPTVEEYDMGVSIPWIRVMEVAPQEGSVAGGEPIAISGSGFSSVMSVTIGGKPLTELRVMDTLITGVTPPGAQGEQNVVIMTSRSDYSVMAGRFFYYPLSGIVVRSVIPTNGKQAGGDLGSITGRGFLPGATVTIGGVPATDVTIAPTLITFRIPPGTEGSKDVAVTNPDGQTWTLHGAYTYNPFPVIEDIEPHYGGPLAGGTEVTITGDHFMEGVIVIIDEQQVQKLDLFSPKELRLKTPPGEAGTKAVSVVNPDGQETIMDYGFVYNPSPTISSVEPNAGPLEGGTLITIIGTGFIAGAKVLVGDAEAPLASRSSTSLTAETSPSTPGVRDVVVVNRDGQKAMLEAGFTYNPGPAITRVIPDNGRLAGGTRITIQGSGFLPGAEVVISTETESFRAASSVQVVSPAIITALTPPGKPGPRDVMVRNPDKQLIGLPEGFTYNPMPTITRITPDHGTTAGGTKLNIEGTGFLQGARVMVGGRVGTTMVKDDMTIEAVTPPNPPGILDVHVINPDTQKAVMREAFVSVGELVYNYPNPFLASEGTTFRYVTNQRVEVITVRIFNLRGVPIGIAQGTDSNEVRWYNPSVHVGLYVYLLEARIEGGKVRRFKNMLEVRK